MHALLILLAIFLWSTGGPLFRSAGLSTPNYILCANAAGVLLLILVFRRRALSRGGSLSLLESLLFSAASATSVLGMFIAFRFTTIGNVIVLHYLAPVIVAILSPLAISERPAARAFEALALSLAGAVAFAWNELVIGSPRDLIGITVSGVSSIAYAGVIMYSRAFIRRGVDPVTLAVHPSIFLWLLILPFTSPASLTPKGAGIAVVAGLLHLSLAVLIYMHGMKGVRASTAGIIGYSEIIFGAAWGWFFFGEAMTPGKWLGTALIVAGGALVMASKKETPATADAVAGARPNDPI